VVRRHLVPVSYAGGSAAEVFPSPNSCFFPVIPFQIVFSGLNGNPNLPDFLLIVRVKTLNPSFPFPTVAIKTRGKIIVFWNIISYRLNPYFFYPVFFYMLNFILLNYITIQVK
jgi:hypothetical protein